jgi:DNA-binding PadR family transcriptional regulator
MASPTSDARALLPLKPLVFQVLLALSEGERHGWSLVREIQTRTGDRRLLPANFYRTLRGMLADGLIQDAGQRVAPDDPQDERRRYFAATPLGREAARLEARRMQELVADARTRRLLGVRGR